MKKIFVILMFSIILLSCDDFFYKEEPGKINIDINSSYSILITGDAPMISISTEDEYYYGLQYGVNYQTTIRKTIHATSMDEYPVNASINVTKMTDDSTTIDVSIIYDGLTIANDSSSDSYATINLSYIYYVHLN